MMRSVLMICLAFGATTPTLRAQPLQNPDWPCAQRLVETLEPGSYWKGPVPAHTAWRDDDTLFALVPPLVDRDTPEDQALAKLRAYAATIAPDKLPALFSALVDQTNDTRHILIQKLERLGRRQRAMGSVIAGLSSKIDTLQDSDPARADLAGQRDFDIRAFGETQRMMRYACEAPANMERRLGVFARALQK